MVNLTATSTASQLKIARVTVADLFDKARIATSGSIKPWQIDRSAKRLISHVNLVRLVKTLWQVDKAVDLREFYCDTHLLIDKKRVMVRQLNDLGDRKQVILTGIAGQGKSILLRYLCTTCLYVNERLPIFIELRRVLPNESLVHHCKQFLKLLGIPDVDEHLVEVLLGTGKIVLFLDGFDEVPEGEKPSIIRDIETLVSTHEELSCIVTSRPKSGLEVSPLLEVIQISDLDKGEYKNVIRKLSESTSFADVLIRQVEAQRSKLSELLCTPLLVTLLVMSYKSFQELPEQLSAFYDSVFQMLLQRHDGAKPGFKRPRKCLINDSQYRSVFENMCYESKRKVKSIFTYDDVSQFTSSAIQKNYLEVDPEKYLDDIVKVTCLILREGDEYRFIHKSVQEYYTAAFIKHRPEPIAKKFYEAILARSLPGSWRQELHFLSEIDRYRFYKFYYLPYLCAFLGLEPENLPTQCPPISLQLTKALLGQIQLGFLAIDTPMHMNSFRHWEEVFEPALPHFVTINYRSVLPAIQDGRLQPIDPSTDPKYLPSPSGSRTYFSVASIIDTGFLVPEFTKMAQQVLNFVYTEACKTQESIAREESIDIQLPI